MSETQNTLWQVATQEVDFRGWKTWMRTSTPVNPDPAKLPVIVLHGGPGMAHNYMLPLEGLAAEGRTVIHYDQLGCGNSTHLPDQPAEFWTPQLFVDEFHNLVEALGFSKYHIIGQSWGGMLAAEIAVRRPEGLVSASICNSPASMELWLEGAARLRGELPAGMDESMKKFEDAGDIENPEYLGYVDEFYRRHVCNVVPTPPEMVASDAQMQAEPTVYHTMNGPNEFHVIGTMKTWSIIDQLHLIEAPCLVLAGEFDEATPETWAPYVANISDVESVVVEGTSHCSHLEKPAEILAILENFMESKEA